jgi:fumarate reductase flavoprotein subunit
MALWVGAAIEDEPHCPVIHFISTNAKPPRMNRPLGMGGMPLGKMPPGGAPPGGAQSSGAMPGMMPPTGFPMGEKSFLYVNKYGERFTNETVAQEHLATIVLRQPGHTMWQILDAKAITSRNKTAADKALTTGEVISGDTLEALAAKFGADPSKFKATVSRYNEIVKTGNDPDFGIAPQNLGNTLDTAPFYACESPPDLLVCMGGIVTNTDMQVLDINKNIIPGLYAAGNLTGGFWGDSYPMSVFPGLARGKALTFGRLAGLHAAKT